MKKLPKLLVAKRVIILSFLGVFVYLGITQLSISLWYIVLAGSFAGIIFGKVFCRWGCPMGLMMEIIMSLNLDGKIRQLYQYHKIGCPIAWISGWLNKYSLFRIRINQDTCKECGLCDKQCYIVSMEPHRFSLYKTKYINPGNSYTCSKCLQCVASCPNGSLKYNV